MSTKRLLFIGGVLVCNTVAIIGLALAVLFTAGCDPTPNPDAHPCVLEAERVCHIYTQTGSNYCSESCVVCVHAVVTKCMEAL